MMKATKNICGRSCQVEVIAGKYLRFLVSASYYECPNKQGLSERGFVGVMTAANRFIVSDADNKIMLEECSDGSCCLWAERLVDFDITDAKAESLQEEILNMFESVFSELKNKLSSASWWLGGGFDFDKDFLLSNSEEEELHHDEALFQYTGTDEKLIAHNGQQAYIVSGYGMALANTKPLYNIRFFDGFEARVCGDTLTLVNESPVDEVLPVSSLENVLSTLYMNSKALNADGLRLVSVLEQIYLQKQEGDSIELADLAAFDSNVVWSKNSDVAYVLESGVYDEDMRRLDLYNEKGATCPYDKEFLDDVASNVDWDDVAQAGVNAGNDIIDDVISGVLETYHVESANITITPREYEMVQMYLRNEEHLGEDDTISFAAAFGNDIEMDIKVCGTQNENECAWTEAVLFEHGHEICCTDVFDELLLHWQMRDGKTMFEVHINIEEEKTEE